MESLDVEIGDKVKKGQLLGVIDPQQAKNSIREGEATLRELHAQLLQAQAEQRLAAVTLQRNQALAKLQAVSRQDLDQAATQLAVKKAQVAPSMRRSPEIRPAWIPPRSTWPIPASRRRWMATWCRSPPCRARR